MERLKSLGSILILILVLAALALVTVIWPAVAESLNFDGFGSLFGGATRPPVEKVPLVIAVPEPVATLTNMNALPPMSGIVVFAVIAAIVVGSVVVFGLLITLFLKSGDKFTSRVAADEAYQKQVAALETREKDNLKTKREAAPAPNKPKGFVYGLDPLSFSLIILFFVALIAALIAAFSADNVEIVIGENVHYVSTLPLTILVLFVITIPVLAWRGRRSRLEAVAETDYASIPWDMIVVLITGLLVVGVGLGLMLLLNRPA